MKKLLIFDASNYMFRAFFASPPMNSSVGFPTNALHFYIAMILSVIRRTTPDAIALAHDFHGPKFRHELYPDYKGQRDAPPEDLQLQFPWFQKLTDAMGLNAYSAERFEADDVIATLTRQAREQDWMVIIASSDKDLMQLIERKDDVDTVVMLDAMAKSGAKNYHALTIDHVLERFQVPPEKVADVLALAGDTIDNIPGCKGIGEKTAGKLIAEYGSLEELMRRIPEIKKPAQSANLKAFAPSAELSKKLTTLVYDVPVSLKLEGMNPKREEVIELFSALELHRLMTDILGPDARPDASVPRIMLPGSENQVVITSAKDDQAKKKSETNKTESPSAIPAAALNVPVSPVEKVRDFVSTDVCRNVESMNDFLTKAQDQQIAVVPLWLDACISRRQLLGVALASSEKSIYVPIRHGRTLFGDLVCADDAEKCIKKCLRDNRIRKAVYGAKSLMHYALANKFELDMSSVFDVELAAYLVHPERSELTLGSCAAEYLGETLTVTPENWLGSGKKAVLPSSFSADQAASFAGLWAQITLQLAEKLPAELKANQLEQVFQAIDLPLCKILAEMEFNGVAVDIPALHSLSSAFDEALLRLDKEAHAFSDDPFNINSPKDLARFLYDVLGLVPATKKNRQHGLSTDQDTLESIDHPIAQIILDYRAISKLRSTYSETLIQQVDEKTRRIHGRFNACVTATTRLSSSEPNLQNIPGRTELGRQIKRTFVPQEGWSFVSADYSQIELRLMAAFSKEPVLCEAYRRGEDIHARTAAALLDIPIEEVTKSQRQLAKTINFGLLYGMGVQKLARETGIAKTEAKAFLEKFHAQFPTLSSYLSSQVDEAKQNGETRTIMGHRRPIPDLFSSRPMLRAFGERVALNAPIQGSASDIVKKAMIRLDQAIHANHLHARLLIQVHDELLLECPDDEVEKTSKILIDAMENALDIGIPLRVELKTGKNWADMS